MDWILKNKNFLCGIRLFLGSAKIKTISQSKKTKALFVVLFLVCIFFVTTPFVYAADSVIGAAFVWGFEKILVGIQNCMILILGIATTLFAAVIDPANISGSNGILNRQAIKDIWIMVRDVLNMAFILVLLFAAFCTIFQYEKWGLKKVWLNILINALLVNFSFPIARFFIDVSNVAMYYFVNNMFSSSGSVTGSTIFASFGENSRISNILNPANFSSYAMECQIAMIIFTFILAMTLLIVAVLFTIRLIALVILVMFSPIGFVGYIFPSSSKLADDWWKQLFSYAFFGPIMIFVMSIALQVAAAIGENNFKSLLTNASVNSQSSLSAWIANSAFFAIPIVILWMGLIVAKKMGGAGADMVVNKGKEWGKAVAASPYGLGKWGMNATGIPGGIKKGWEDIRKSGKIFGTEEKLFKSGRANREAGIGGILSGGKKGWQESRNKKRQDENKENIEKGAKSIVEGGATADTLAQDVNTHFATPATTKADKLKHASSAAAYLRQDHEERKMHIKTALQSKGSVAGSGIENILNAKTPTHFAPGSAAADYYEASKKKAQDAADIIAKGGAGSDNKKHMEAVAAFVNRQMKSQVKTGADAT